jgi:hypothetical protein
MITYKLVKSREGVDIAVNCSNGWSIPFDPSNSDYQAYLKFLAEGGTPLPADSSIADATSSVVTEQEVTE